MLDKYRDEKKAIAAYTLGETELDRLGGVIPEHKRGYVEDVLRFKKQYEMGEPISFMGEPISFKGSDVVNNNQITINLVGQTEDQERRIEQIVRRVAAGDASIYIRTAGVAV